MVDFLIGFFIGCWFLLGGFGVGLFLGHHPAPFVSGSLCSVARCRSALRFAAVFLPLVVTTAQR